MNELARVAREARAAYVRRIAGGAGAGPWWTSVLITAGSARQAAHFEEEIRRRLLAGHLPSEVRYLAVADAGDRRLGSGGATLHALRVFCDQAPVRCPPSPVPVSAGWWASQRVLLLHSGGQSRRLPQYSLSGKLFSALPVKAPWGDPSTVFDEFLALSSAWAERLESGLLVASGDVILTFDAARLAAGPRGVSGVAIRQPAALGAAHGVYVTGEGGRVYAFLQKPSHAQVEAAGGVLADGRVALDSGLLHFDAATAARLARLGADNGGQVPYLDLYRHFTGVLTGAAGVWPPLADALGGVPFWCSVVDGDFTHVGTTRHFRRLFSPDSRFGRLYEAQQRLGGVLPRGVCGAGVVLDSVLPCGGELGTGAMVIECHLGVPVRAGAGAILHGLEGLEGPIEVPPDTVVHQVAVNDGTGPAAVIRVYGVDDDPKASGAESTWFGRPIREELRNLELDEEAVWEGVPAGERSLWNARLFAAGDVERAWACARWLLRLEEGYTAAEWRKARRFSLADCARAADIVSLAASQARRRQAAWRLAAVDLARSGTDVRPLLAHAPAVAAAAEAGRVLAAEGAALLGSEPTEAASRFQQAHLFLRHAGLADEALSARADAFRAVRHAVDAGAYDDAFGAAAGPWRHSGVIVSAPPRLDLGGGWSDTPPFCLDWGGAVVNVAVCFGDEYPIRTEIRRLSEPVLRLVSGADGRSVEYREATAVLAPPAVGSPFEIARMGVAMAGLARPDQSLAQALAARGGGLEIVTVAELPLGSGLGTSSILAATLLGALAEMAGARLTRASLCEQVMRLEQRMTTGGGWQDQVGAIYPGAKLAVSGPGLRQRIRVEPLGWSAARRREFAARFVLYYTGIPRLARGLLARVVSGYLAREVAVVQVLHSIKTLALEMAWAMREGAWEYLGELLNRHWELNQVLDPHTTNAPITALLREVRPLLAGAKLAGAGGGGFLMLLAKGPAEARELEAALAARGGPPGAAVYRYRIARGSMRMRYDEEAPVGASPAARSHSATLSFPAR